MAEMNLFNTESNVAGFKLNYMEIYNWGTFNNKIYEIVPQGNNSLLTGANGSGKSTLIDALLTLLIPFKRKRFYNQSSGVEKKGNRTEESYFYGEYGNQQKDGEIGVHTLRLRDKNSRSVLLANFKSSDNKILTIFQIRYISGEELKTVYGIGKTELHIETDFAAFDGYGNWRKNLERKYNTNTSKKIIEFCSGPNEYGEKIKTLGGLQSDKAFTLFNQIVGVKVLDDLDIFIRNNMLEEHDAEEAYKHLREMFDNLMGAKRTLEKTKRQIELLEPINESAELLTQFNKDINNTTQKKEQASYWFAHRLVELCNSKNDELENKNKQFENELNGLAATKNALYEEIATIKANISQDKTGQRISELEKNISRLTIEKNKKIEKSNSYKNSAKELGLTEEPTKEGFLKDRDITTSKLEKIKAEIEETRRKIYDLSTSNEELKNNIDENIEVIKSLQDSQNNIVGRVSEIRNELLNLTHASKEEIPFIGELIKVKEEEQPWESTIEKILHNFALRLLVPEKYYNQINEYVNSHDLKGRIVYHRYKDYSSIIDYNTLAMKENCLFKKVDFKSDSTYIDWIKDKIYEDYNYSCVENLEEFRNFAEKAATKEGLILSTKGKHEKDDRPSKLGKNNFVLGWENKEKIAALQKEVKNAQDQQNKIQSLKQQQEILLQQRSSIEKQCNLVLYTFENFEDIDWTTVAKEIQKALEEKEGLEKTNDKIKELQKQLASKKQDVEKVETEEKTLNKKQGAIEQQIKEIEKKRDENLSLVSLVNNIDTSALISQHPELLQLNFDTIEDARKEFLTEIKRSFEKQTEEKGKTINRIKDRVRKFKYPDHSIIDLYPDWNSDVHQLPEADNLELIDEYQTFYKHLVEEDLKSIEAKFNSYLHETLTQDINTFRIFFDQWESEIKSTILQLNEPLKGIDFDTNPTTYIQLIASKKIDTSVHDFKEMLRKSIPNLNELSNTIDGKRVHFEKYIAPLIKKLEDEQWRKRVMDVRSWFSYKAEEFYKESNTIRKTYQSMGQLSGGEKAQLTYTILGSAIAYQFGLTKSNTDSSFRFIAVDEAFKAQDETKSRFLISLCKQLHLQLLVVTPSDNIHIVENDISYVHYVERRENESVLYNMPIFEFKEKREQYNKQ